MLWDPHVMNVRDLTRKEAKDLQKTKRFAQLREDVEAMFVKKGWFT
jgi:hypothetical protein